MYLNDELCIVRPILIDLNPIELDYYPFIISLDKRNGMLLMTFLPKYALRVKQKT